MVVHDFFRYTKKLDLPFHFFGKAHKKAPGRIPGGITTLINQTEIFSNPTATSAGVLFFPLSDSVFFQRFAHLIRIFWFLTLGSYFFLLLLPLPLLLPSSLVLGS
jgi:hypothetical protein